MVRITLWLLVCVLAQICMTDAFAAGDKIRLQPGDQLSLSVRGVDDVAFVEVNGNLAATIGSQERLDDYDLTDMLDRETNTIIFEVKNQRCCYAAYRFELRKNDALVWSAHDRLKTKKTGKIFRTWVDVVWPESATESPAAWGSSEERSTFTPEVVSIRAYGRDLTDRSSLCEVRPFPNIWMDDDPKRCKAGNAVWTGSYKLTEKALILNVKGLTTRDSPGHRLAIGYTVGLAGATFKDGSTSKNFILAEFSRRPQIPNHTLKVPIRVAKPKPPPSLSAGVPHMQPLNFPTTMQHGEASSQKATRGEKPRLQLEACPVEGTIENPACRESAWALLNQQPGYEDLVTITASSVAAMQQARRIVPLPELQTTYELTSHSYFSLGDIGAKAVGSMPYGKFTVLEGSFQTSIPRVYWGYRILEVGVALEAGLGTNGDPHVYVGALGYKAGISLGRPPWATPDVDAEWFIEASTYLVGAVGDDMYFGLPAGIFLGSRLTGGVMGFEVRGGLEWSPVASEVGLVPRASVQLSVCLICGLENTYDSHSEYVGLPQYHAQLTEQTYRNTLENTQPADLQLELTFSDASGLLPDKAIQSGEDAILTAAIRNEGEGTARGLSLEVTCDPSDLTPSAVSLPASNLRPGQSASVDIPLQAALSLQDGQASCVAQVLEARGYHSKKVRRGFDARHLGSPAVALGAIRIQDGRGGYAQGNADGRLQNGEVVELQVPVRNVGDVPMFGVILNVKPISHQVVVDPAKVYLEDLPPGRERMARFRLETGRDLSAREIKLETRVTEARVGPIGEPRIDRLPVEQVESRLVVQVEPKSRPENGRSVSLDVSLRNQGKLSAEDVSVDLSGRSAKYLSERQARLGTLRPGEQQTWSTTLSLPDSFDAPSVQLEAHVRGNGQLLGSGKHTFSVDVSHPQIVLNPRMAGQRGTVYPTALGSPMALYVEVFNKGTRDATGVQLTVIAETSRGAVHFSYQKTCHVGTLEPRQQFTCDFLTKRLPRGLEAGTLPVTLTAELNHYPAVTRTFEVSMIEDEETVAILEAEPPPRVTLAFAKAGRLGDVVDQDIDLQRHAAQIGVELPMAARIKRPDGAAFLIGIQDYQSTEIPPVSWAEQDVRTMRDYVVNTLGFKANRVTVRTEDQVTSGKLQALLREELPAQVSPGKTDLFFYYVGHGVPADGDGRPYLATWDADLDYITSTGVSLKDLMEAIVAARPRSAIVVIDACFSGNYDGGALVRNISAPRMKPQQSIRQQTPVDGIHLFTATSSGEVACWYPEEEHSLFTWHFLKGLQGSADLDKDKTITVQELGDYLAGAVPPMADRLRNRSQNPRLRTADGSYVLTRY